MKKRFYIYPTQGRIELRCLKYRRILLEENIDHPADLLATADSLADMRRLVAGNPRFTNRIIWEIQ